MLDVYLVSLLSVLLTEYGFQTRKQAMSHWSFGWRVGRSLFRIGIWILALLWWFLEASVKWPILILFAVAIIVGESIAFIIRKRTRHDVEGNYPLGRPTTHLLPFISAFIPMILAGLFIHSWFPQSFLSLPISPTLALKVAIGITSMFCWSTMFTVSMVGLVRSNKFSDEIEPHLGGGEVIGILERLFTFVLVIAGGLSAVGFAVAAKAAARFPQFKNPIFAEYFLIGTLCSIGVAVLFGLAVGFP